MIHVIPPFYHRENNSIDYFKRNDLKENLVRLFSNTENSLVLTLNAVWGEGKTTFIKSLEKRLKQSNEFIPIYYDAFKHDFSSDAFISIAVIIQRTIENSVGSDKIDIKDYKEATVELGLELGKMTSNLALNITTGGLLAADSLLDWATGKYKEKKEESEKIKIRGSKELINEKYDAYFKKGQLLKQYHEKLRTLLKDDTNYQRKIIFFVDELDRCRPNFAIEVLEKIKHFFSVDNVIFVLAINREQLVQIIMSAYGVEKKDASIYLQKFVHVETNLPAMNNLRTNDGKENLITFIQELKNLFRIPDEHLDTTIFSELILILMNTVQFTPRSIERVLTLFAISMDSCSIDKRNKYSKEILFLSVFKVEIPEYYDKIKKEGIVRESERHEQYSLHKSFIKHISEGYFFESSKIKEKGVNRLSIPSLIEASKIVDIYDIPKEEKSIKDILGKNPKRDSDRQKNN